MVDVDWLQLIFVVGTALVAGGVAYGGARARAQAFEESFRREADGLRRELDALRADHKDLARRFEACMLHRADSNH